MGASRHPIESRARLTGVALLETNRYPDECRTPPAFICNCESLRSKVETDFLYREGALMRNKRRKLLIDRFQTTLWHSNRSLLPDVPGVGRPHVPPGTKPCHRLPQGNGAGGVRLWGRGHRPRVLGIYHGVYLGRDQAQRIASLVRLSSFAGRFRRSLQERKWNSCKLRKDDYLHELRDEFNEMLRVLENRGAIQLKTSDKADVCDFLGRGKEGGPICSAAIWLTKQASPIPGVRRLTLGLPVHCPAHRVSHLRCSADPPKSGVKVLPSASTCATAFSIR